LRIKRVLGYSVTFLGILMALAAIGAELLGIDRDAGWGPARVFLLAVGLTLVTLANLGDLIRRFTRSSHQQPDEEQGGKSAKGSAPIRSLSTMESRPAQTPLRDRTLSLSLIAIFCISAVTLTWLISFGRWKSWPETTNYYHLLADGFRAGETHLLVEPDPRLLALENPYEVANRDDVTYLWDVSLYNGKYFLYWGPVPAAVLLGLEFITGFPIGDQHLVWFFSVLNVLFLMLFLRMLWLEVFSHLSVISIVPVALAAALINPLPWLMTRAAVYEAAVSGGQAFFIGGALMLAPLLWRDRISAGRVVVGSTFWVLAVGSRISLVLAVVLLPIGLALFLLIRFRRTGRSGKRVLVLLGYLLVPLLIGALMLAWYNFDRFGSIIELGHRYQLGRWNMHDNYYLVATLGDVPVNIFNYYFNPPGLLQVFPYIKPSWGRYAIPILRYMAPENYHTEQVTGILIASPVILLTILPFVSWFRTLWHNIDTEEAKRIPVINPFVGGSFERLFTGSIAALLLVSIPMLAVSFISMRHELDIIPTLFICAVLGYGFGLQRFSSQSIQRRLLLLVSSLAAIWAIIASMLLAVTGYASTFERINPALFDKITRFFTW